MKKKFPVKISCGFLKHLRVFILILSGTKKIVIKLFFLRMLFKFVHEAAPSLQSPIYVQFCTIAVQFFSYLLRINVIDKLRVLKKITNRSKKKGLS